MAEFPVALDSLEDLPKLVEDSQTLHRSSILLEKHYSNIKVETALELAGNNNYYQRSLLIYIAAILITHGILITSISFFFEAPIMICEDVSGNFKPCSKQAACTEFDRQTNISKSQFKSSLMDIENRYKSPQSKRLKYQIVNSQNFALISKYNLECDDQFIVENGKSIMLVLSSLITFLLVIIFDNFERRVALWFSLFLEIIGIVGLIFTSKYELTLLAIIITYTGVFTFLTILFIYVNEVIGGRLRIICLPILFLVLAVSNLILPALVYNINDPEIIFSLLTISSIFSSFSFVHFVESPFYIYNNRSIYSFFKSLELICKKNFRGREYDKRSRALLNYIFNWQVSWEKKNIKQIISGNKINNDQLTSQFISQIEESFEVETNVMMSSIAISHVTYSMNDYEFPKVEDEDKSLTRNDGTRTSILGGQRNDDYMSISADEQAINGDNGISNKSKKQLNTEDEIKYAPSKTDQSLLDLEEVKDDSIHLVVNIVSNESDEKCLRKLTSIKYSKILRKYSKINNKNIHKQRSYLYILSPIYMWKITNLLVLSISVFLCYGLTFMTTRSISKSSIFYNQLFLSLIEIFAVSTSIILMRFLPRKAIIVASQFLVFNCSFFFVVISLIFGTENSSLLNYNAQYFISLFFFILIKISCVWGLIAIHTYVADSFPTYLRLLVLVVVLTAGRISLGMTNTLDNLFLGNEQEYYQMLLMVGFFSFPISLVLPDSNNHISN